MLFTFHPSACNLTTAIRPSRGTSISRYGGKRRTMRSGIGSSESTRSTVR